MNRKKALFCYEMKNMVWFLLLGLLLAVWVCISVYGSISCCLPEMQNVTIYQYSSSGSFLRGSVFAACLAESLKILVCLCVIGFAFMALVQFSDLHGRKQREYLNALPFSQQEKFLMKVFVSYGTITLCWLLMSVGIIAIRMIYQGRMIKYNALAVNFRQFIGSDTIWHTIRSLLLCWLTLLALYSVYMAVHYLINQHILSFIIGLCALYYPAMLNHVVLQDFLGSEYYYRIFCSGEKYDSMVINAGTYQQITALSTRLSRYSDIFFGSAFGQVYSDSAYLEIAYWPRGDSSLLEHAVTVSYGKMWAVFLIVIILLLFCTILAWRTNQRQDLSKIHGIVPKAAGRIGLSIGISTSLAGVIITWVCSETPLILCVGAWLLLSLFLSVLCQKILKRI